MKHESISFGDRLAAAVISALIMGFTAIFGPAVFIIESQHRSLERLSRAYRAFHAWGSVVVLFAFAAGFVLGTKRVTQVLAHLWYTAEPRRPGITLTLWAVLVGVGVAAYWIFG